MKTKKYHPTSLDNNKGAFPLTKPQIKHVCLVAGASGRTPERDEALLLCSITMGLRVSEIACLEVRHIIGEDGKYLLEGWLPGEFSKSGRSAAIFPSNKKFQKALDKYIEYRLNKRHMISGDLSKYRGLNPESKVFLTETGRKFAMTTKRRKSSKGKPLEYKACDTLERAFKRLYKKAFGDDTQFSSHSGRKVFSNNISDLVESKAHDQSSYQDVVNLMRSHNIESIQPYLVPSKKEIQDIAKNIY
ncbi:hypothetical protein A3715_15570 [Oleiphilus sp. HI0009]|nr:hypothetical protein A3715_15570 [Oleiphilus sp. HI0009]